MYACVCMHACVYVCMHVCIYVCMYACMYVCMHVCMYACMCTYACMGVYACGVWCGGLADRCYSTHLGFRFLGVRCGAIRTLRGILRCSEEYFALFSDGVFRLFAAFFFFFSFVSDFAQIEYLVQMAGAEIDAQDEVLSLLSALSPSSLFFSPLSPLSSLSSLSSLSFLSSLSSLSSLSPLCVTVCSSPVYSHIRGK